MTKMQRVRAVLGGLVTLFCCAVLLYAREDGYRLIIAIVGLGLVLRGAKFLIQYFSLGRHMVGGRRILFYGIIALDLGLFAYAISDLPPVYLMLYLLVGHLFSGVVDVLRALEVKRMESGRWRLNLANGIANILLALACLFCLRSVELLVYIYTAGLAYTACLRIASGFRKSAIIHIA